MKHSSIVFACSLLLSVLTGMAHATAAPARADPFHNLAFRNLGPSIMGGRVSSVVGIPGNPKVYYVGAASGGVWKSTDGGYQWKAIFTHEPTASISDVVLDPSNPNIVWVATGEVNIRNDVLSGAGLYRSKDAGKTWTLMGFKNAGNISKVVVDPHDSNIVWVAVLGHVWGPNAERGVFKTTDGGKTWKKVLFINNHTGAIDLTTDGANSQILFAAMWQAQRYPWKLEDGGSYSGLWRSTDGGDTWTKLRNGIPKPPLGRIAVAVAPSNPHHVYALIETRPGHGLLFGSHDLGSHWQQVSDNYALDVRPFYFSHVYVAPHNENELYFTSLFLMKSDDGGHSAHPIDYGVHTDHHSFWQDPTNPSRMIDGEDAGVYISLDAGAHWRFVNTLPIEQFYQVAADSSQPYNLCGGLQDGEGWCGPSVPPPTHLPFYKKVIDQYWFYIPLGDGQYVVPAPTNPNIIYADGQGGHIVRYNVAKRSQTNIQPYSALASTESKDRKYRFNWTAPIVVSPTSAKTVYLGGDVVFKSSDAGQSWRIISPDLTRNDKAKQRYSGGPVNLDISGAETYDTLLSLELAPTDQKVMWAGSDDGLVHVTRDGGKHWDLVTPPGAPRWGRVFKIGVSPFDAGTAYVAFDNHEMDDRRPYVYETNDYGKTWHSIAKGLPQQPVLVVREDPNMKGFLMLGNMTGLWYSQNDGRTWQKLNANFPTAAVFDLKFVHHGLVVATHGRGLFVLDNLRPVEEMTAQIAKQNFHLFTPSVGTQYSFAVGRHKPEDVSIDYYLKDKLHRTPADKAANRTRVKIVVTDAAGDIVDTGFGPEMRGVNEFRWNMSYAPAVALAFVHKKKPGHRSGPPVMPGTYRVTVTADGHTQSEAVTVRGDPNRPISPAIARANLEFSLRIRNQLSAFHEMLNRITAMQSKLNDITKSLVNHPASHDKDTALVTLGRELNQKLMILKNSVYNPLIQRNVIEDDLHFPARLNRDLQSLGVSNPTRAPNASELANANAVGSELDHKLAQFNGLLAGDVTRYNKAARAVGVATLKESAPVRVSEVHM